VLPSVVEDEERKREAGRPVFADIEEVRSRGTDGGRPGGCPCAEVVAIEGRIVECRVEVGNARSGPAAPPVPVVVW